MLASALLGFALAVPQDPPAAAPTVVFEGRVVDLRGEGVPLAQVQVKALWTDDEVLAKGMCDGDGYFRIGRVPARPQWTLQASAKGYCSGQAYASGEPSPVRIELQEAATVRGVLRDRAGEPVPGALVRATLSARILYATRCDARTDDAGAFTLTGVPLGFVRLAAVVPGEGVAEARKLVQGDAEVGLRIGSEPTTSLAIAVAGLPAAAAAALRPSILPYRNGRLERLPPPWEQPQFVDGKCELAPVPDLEYRVRLSLDGFAFAPAELVVKPGTGPHQLQFTASATGAAALQWRAELRDGDGKPLPGVRLVLRQSSGGARAEAQSGDDGSLVFRSPLAAGTKVIVYSVDPRWVLDQPKADGMYGAWDRRFLADHECTVDPAAPLQLRAIPACSVSGTLLRADGRPAAFVRVELEESNANRMPTWMMVAHATTDRDGQFAIRGQHPIPDPVRIHVEGVLGAAASEPFAFYQPGMAVKVQPLQLSPPATVEGTVVDAQQRPAPGIRVWLRDWEFAKNNQKSGSVVEVITDRLGRYRFVGVPPGGAWLQLLVDEAHPRDRAVEPFEVEAGRSYAFTLQLPAK